MPPKNPTDSWELAHKRKDRPNRWRSEEDFRISEYSRRSAVKIRIPDQISSE